MDNQLYFTDATEDELNSLLAGREAGVSTRWPDNRKTIRISQKTFGVVSHEAEADELPQRPLALVLDRSQHQRLFGRIAQLRGDLSPLSSWLHLLSAEMFDSLDSSIRTGDLAGLDAAWIGLIVAEATIGARRPTSQLKLVSCLASQSFAVAKTLSLWPRVELKEILERFDAARGLLGSGEAPATRMRPSLLPIWSAMIAASFGELSGRHSNSLTIQCILTLKNLRRDGLTDEARALSRTLDRIDESKVLLNLDDMSPETRVQAFDVIVKSIRMRDRSAEFERDALCFLAGYIATKAAGGVASLGLAAELAEELPAISVWAHVIGGIGEQVTWTSGFDGLGRLVSRELRRPFRLDEPPTCDFSIEEAVHLVDRQLTDPTVFLKIKQTRSVTVSLLPGVDVALPLSDATADPNFSSSSKQLSHRAEAAPPTGPNLFGALADALWPHIEARVSRLADKGSQQPYSRATKGRNNLKSRPQGKLPLDRDG